MHIRWLIGVIGLLYRPFSIFKSSELIRYLTIAVIMWFPFHLRWMFHKYFLLMNMCAAYLYSRYLSPGHYCTLLDVVLRDGSRIFLPRSSIRSLVSPKNSLKLNSLGGGVFLGHALFTISGDVQCDKSVHLCHTRPICTTFVSFRTGLVLFDNLEG